MMRTLHILARTVGSVVGLLAGEGLAYLGARGASSGITDWDNADYLFAAVILYGGLALGAITGAALGAATTQMLLKQRCSFRRALLGTFVGLVFGGLPAFPLIATLVRPPLHTNEAYVVGYCVVCGFVVAGAVFGSNWGARSADAAGSRS